MTVNRHAALLPWPLLVMVALVGSCRCRDGSAPRRSGTSPPVVVLDPDEIGRPAPDAEREPNDRRRDAQPLAADASVEGKVVSAKDQDWYRVEVEDGDRVLTARLTGVPGHDLSIEAHDAAGKRLVRVNNRKHGEGEVLVNLTVSRGTYYLRVRQGRAPVDEGRTRGTYRVSYVLRALEEGEEREPNWKPSLATPLALDEDAIGYLGWHTDTDCYRVELEGLVEGARLRVEFDGVDNVRANLAVRSAGGATLQQRWGGMGEGVVLPNLKLGHGDGPLGVVLRTRYHYNVESRYSLRVVSRVPSVPTEAEPNDMVAGATPLELDTTMAGMLADGRDVDLLAVRGLASPGWVRVRVVPPLGMDVALGVVDDKGQLRWEVDAGGARDPEQLPRVWFTPGRDLVRLRAPKRRRVSVTAAYRVRVERLTGAADAWEREPNDDSARATPWPAASGEISGHLHPPEDQDVFRVSTTGERLMLAIAPPATGGLRLLATVKDSAGATLSTSSVKGETHLDVPVEAGEDVWVSIVDQAGKGTPDQAYRMVRENP